MIYTTVKLGSTFKRVWLEQDYDGYSAVITGYPDDAHPDCELGHECSPLFSRWIDCQHWINARTRGWVPADDEWKAHVTRQDEIVRAEVGR